MPDLPSCDRHQVETLMEAAATLGDFTQSPESCVQVPSYLAKLLRRERMSLGVVSHIAGKDPQVVISGSSASIAKGEEATVFQQNLLAIYRHTRPLETISAPALRESFSVDLEEGFSEIAVQQAGIFQRVVVFGRTIDAEHRMLLIVHQRPEEEQLATSVSDTINLLSALLAKLLKCVVSWRANPEILGEPFERLTDREWVVLQALNSDDGEKQLADRLQLSPHTLHSHIKSIYRKIGVQGRLPLLLRLTSAVRDLRIKSLSNVTRDPLVRTYAKPTAAVAV